MNQEKTNLAKLLAKYLNNECNDSEKEILQAWLMKSEKNQKVLDDLQDPKKLQEYLVQYNLFDKEAAWKEMSRQFLEGDVNVTKFNTRWLLMVASIIVIVFSATLFFIKYSVPDDTQIVNLTDGKILKDASGEILPATTGAILVKSTGEQVILDKSFTLLENGSISFDESVIQDQGIIKEDSFYELIVPKAKIIQFIMFDGSKIWVNANSRLQIPTKSNSDRTIKLLTGEIYLEVTKYKNSKFFVETQNGSVEVLGTKFNVISSDKSFKTTLVEGKVKLVKEQTEQILEPNTSGIWRDTEFVVTNANLNADLAWKNNVFYFIVVR
jgi:transmembrane sensor